MRKSGLPWVVDENTEILILGTLPSDLSIAAQQYYANPGNDFWKLLGAGLKETFAGLAYGDKLDLLRANRIGLWDAFQTCVRPGSMDSDITEYELNDFKTPKNIAPKIKLICYNGRKATQAERSLHALGYETRILPSSSGANRRVEQERISSWTASILSAETPKHKARGGPPLFSSLLRRLRCECGASSSVQTKHFG